MVNYSERLLRKTAFENITSPLTQFSQQSQRRRSRSCVTILELSRDWRKLRTTAATFWRDGRVSIARAFGQFRPKVCDSDEPFGALDTITRKNHKKNCWKFGMRTERLCWWITRRMMTFFVRADRLVMRAMVQLPASVRWWNSLSTFARSHSDYGRDPQYYKLRNALVSSTTALPTTMLA